MGQEQSREIEKFGTNPYNILGVTQDSSIDDIKRAYRAKAKILHPDRNRNADGDVDPGIELEFKIVNEAYKILSNPKTRKLYDNSKSAGYDDLASLYTAKNANGKRRNADYSQDPDFHIAKNNELPDQFRAGDTDRFNELFDKQRAPEPGDAGYGVYGTDLAPRMTVKEGDEKNFGKIKRMYESERNTLKPKKMFKPGKKFNSNHFNAVFEQQKKKHRDDMSSEIIVRDDDIEGWGTFGGGSLSSMVSDVSTHGGLMIVGRDSNFGALSSNGGYYDYKESFDGHYNPDDLAFVNDIDPDSYNGTVAAMSKKEFEDAFLSRQSEFDKDIDVAQISEEEHLAGLYRNLKEEADQKAEFTRKYARGQYPQHFLDAADEGQLDSRSNALLEHMTLLNLDGDTSRSVNTRGTGRIDDDYNRLLQERNNDIFAQQPNPMAFGGGRPEPLPRAQPGREVYQSRRKNDPFERFA